MKTELEGKGPGQAEGVSAKSKKAGLKRPDAIEAACYILLICSAAMALWAMTRAIDKPLFGPHSFRQTQTAISAYYMAKDPSMFFNYITPVLGKPWEIPMEVPVYQWLVARLHNFTGIELDAAGRIVSILAWFLCMIPVWSILRSLGAQKTSSALGCAVMLSSPLYLFWGQAFLVETTALLFSLSMVACGLVGIQEKRRGYFVLAFVFGLLAALCKVTTWAVAAGTGGLLILAASGLPKTWRKSLMLGAAAAAFLLPVVPAKIWLSWADGVKEKNPFARELIIANSPNQKAWNFGTLEQKLSPQTWEVISQHAVSQILPPGGFVGPVLLLAIIAAGMAVRPGARWPTGCMLAGFFSGPLIFTNLYFEHGYYWTANGVWLLLAVATALSALFSSGKTRPFLRLLAVFLGAALCVLGHAKFAGGFLPIFQSIPSREQIESAWTRPVSQHVPEGSVLLIIGNDWNPNGLYYAKRKGIAFPTAKWIPFPGRQLDESLQLLSVEEPLGGMVISQPMLGAQNESFWISFLSRHGMSLQGVPTPFGILFPSKGQKQKN